MSENHSPDALREKILALTYQCPKGAYTRECPFGILRGLGHESRRSTFAQMSEKDLLRLFELATDCACPAAPPREAPA